MGIIYSNELINYDFVYQGKPFIMLSNDRTISTNGLDYLDYFDLFSIANKNSLEIEFSFLSGIADEIDMDLIVKNCLTENIEIEEEIKNSLLPYNEVEKNFILINMLDKDSLENYNGFYFNKLHGV